MTLSTDTRVDPRSPGAPSAPANNAATPGPTDGSAPKRNWSWVPIRSLTPRHRERILAHLLALTENDRYLRFGYPATDAQIARYVDTLDFDRDEVFGIFNRKIELIAAAHLAYSPAPQRSDEPAMAEFGVSVLPTARGRHFETLLCDFDILHV